MEEVVLNGLLTSDGFFSKAYSHIETNLFSNPENSVIYDTIKEFVDKYQNRPSIRDIGLAIKETSKINNKLKLKTIEKYKEIIKEHKVDNLDFLLNNTEDWIKRTRLIDAILKSSDMIKKGDEFDPIVGMVEDALNVSFDSSVGLDYSSSLEERLEYYKRKDMYSAIGIKSVDKSLGGGLKNSTLTILGAFVHEGKCHTYDNYINIYVSDEELDNIKKSGVDYEIQ